jgi:hypothetical protein
MSDLKSKLPDLKELTGMAGKLFGDVKKSVVEIIGSYKEKHKDSPVENTAETKTSDPTDTPEATPEAPAQEPEQEAEPPQQTDMPSDDEPPKQNGE